MCGAIGFYRYDAPMELGYVWATGFYRYDAPTELALFQIEAFPSYSIVWNL